MARRFTRRSFLAGLAAGTMGTISLRGRGVLAAEDAKLRVAAVGVGNQGADDLRSIVASGRVEVTALCDIDQEFLSKSAASYPQARQYRDWREMFAAETQSMDAVLVATPDHMHALAAMTAIQAGKHVYCEKPLAHDLFEVRRLMEAAREKGVVTQMGTQIHSHACYKSAARMLQDGAIGKIKEWHSWLSAGYSTPGMHRPEGEDSVPESVAWDLWLGSAPARPFKNDTYHPKKWRYWRDFGCGALGDFGCHIFDPVFTGTGVRQVLNVSAEIPEHDPEVWPPWEIIRYEFAGTEFTAGPSIKATWYDGGKRPEIAMDTFPQGYSFPDQGSLVIGEEGMMVIPHYDEAQLYPADKYKDYARPGLEPVSHYAEWVNACLGSGTASCNFEYAGPLAEAVLLGCAASRVPGQRLDWDQTSLQFSNVPDANALVKRAYRDGWAAEGLA